MCLMNTCDIYLLCWVTPVVFIGFFFFKQKTAYEMRISDWSSDVCSSDLMVSAAEQHAQQVRESVSGLHEQAQEEILGLRSAAEHVADRMRREASEIGRASCRERVCK